MSYADSLADLDDIQDGSSPNVVYHYTTAAGLQGILTNGAIWATDLLYLNDSAELEYVFSFLTDLAELRALAEGTHGTTRVVESKVAHIVDRLTRTYIEKARIYVACFCRKGNLLSQWRGYAGGTGGFSIGLRWNDLRLAHPQSRFGQNWDFDPIVYDRAAQKAQVQDILRPLLLGALEKWVPSAPEEQALTLSAELLGASLLQVGRIGPTFKSPAFAEEQEWRAIRRTDEGQPEPVKFRTAAVGLTPYVELDIKDPSNGKLLINEIWIGPSPDQHLAKRAVGTLLQQVGFAKGEVPIHRSDTSLR
jgi:hypothetical protein